jgi:hypothetical protein
MSKIPNKDRDVATFRSRSAPTSPHPLPQHLGVLHKVARPRIGRRRLPHPPQCSECNALPGQFPELRFSATLGEEPEVEVALV